MTEFGERIALLEQAQETGCVPLHTIRERMATMEANLQAILKPVQELQKDVKAMQQTIWKAMGGVGVILVVVQLVLKHL